jgi:hypothetical protein
VRHRTDSAGHPGYRRFKNCNVGESIVSLKKFQMSLVPFALVLMFAGCEKKGVLERAGEEIDEAVEDVRAGGETTGNKIDDAVDEVRDAADDVRKDLE